MRDISVECKQFVAFVSADAFSPSRHHEPLQFRGFVFELEGKKVFVFESHAFGSLVDDGSVVNSTLVTDLRVKNDESSKFIIDYSEAMYYLRLLRERPITAGIPGVSDNGPLGNREVEKVIDPTLHQG